MHHTKADMNPFKIDGIADGVEYMPRKESGELLKHHQMQSKEQTQAGSTIPLRRAPG